MTHEAYDALLDNIRDYVFDKINRPLEDYEAVFIDDALNDMLRNILTVED
jgi:hypothetical protein